MQLEVTEVLVHAWLCMCVRQISTELFCYKLIVVYACQEKKRVHQISLPNYGVVHYKIAPKQRVEASYFRMLKR